MKKMYFIFSLLLMVLGINTAYAGVILGENIADPSALKAGDQVIIRGDRVGANDATLSNKVVSALADSLLFDNISASGDALDPSVVFNLVEAGGKTINGKPAFYFQNNMNKKYLTYVFINKPEGEGGSIVEGGAGYEMRLAFTDDVNKAIALAVITQAEGATEDWFNYTSAKPANETAMMVVGMTSESKDKILALSQYWANPYVATYGDWPSWWQIYRPEDDGNPISGLEAFFKKVKDFNYKAGTAPGCYPEEIVAAFEAAKIEANNLIYDQSTTEEQANACLEKLQSSYVAILTGEPAPVREGYFRITTAYSEYYKQQGETEGAKTIYAEDGRMKWKALDKEDASMVWQFIDRKDGTWLAYNIGTGHYMNGVNTSVDSTNNSVKFQYLDMSQFNVFSKGNQLHTDGHASGAGKQGVIVTWGGGVNSASSWYITELTKEEEEKFEAIGEQSRLNALLAQLYNKANAKYSIGSVYDDSLITSAELEANPDLIVSNSDHNTINPGAPDGQGYPALLDHDPATFWHSAWQNAPAETPYLQFTLNKSVSEFFIFLQNRPGSGGTANFPTKLRFFVNSEPANEEGWEKVDSIPVAYDANGNFMSRVLKLGSEYNTIRVFWDAQNKFTHFGTFHIIGTTLSENCQNAQLGPVAVELKNQLDIAAAAITAGNATQKMIDDLQNAYNNYIEAMADPTDLKHKLDSVQNIYKYAATPTMQSASGTMVFAGKEGYPGVYTDAAKAELKVAIDAVADYIEAREADGKYSKDDLKTHTSNLLAACDAFRNTAPKLMEAAADGENGLWYYISYSKNYFDMTGSTPDKYPTENPQYIRGGKIYVDYDGTSGLNNYTINAIGADPATGEPKEVPAEKDDYAKWRFINLGDTAYAIQNKGTGLYIGKKTGGNAGLSMTPVAFKLKDLGYATFLFDGFQFDGQKTSPLHLQTNGLSVVFWNNYDLGGGSCFDIEPTSETADGVAYTANIENVVKGRLYIKTYPFEITGISDGIADEAGVSVLPYEIKKVDLEKKQLVLSQFGTNYDPIPAGRPFFYVAGGNEIGVTKPIASADTTMLYAFLDVESTKRIAQQPQTVNGLVGNYYGGKEVEAGFGVVAETEEGVISLGATAENAQIGWNSGYVACGAVTEIEGEEGANEIVVNIGDDVNTAIKDAIIDAQTGKVNVYSIDGVLVKKNVKVSEAVKGLSKGIYIIGNQKVAVK